MPRGLLLDMGISPTVIDLARELGIEAQHVGAMGYADAADGKIAHYAQNMILLS